MNVTADCVSYMQNVFFSDTRNYTDLLDTSNNPINTSSNEVLKLKPEERPDFLQKVCGFATKKILRSLPNISVNKYDRSDNHVTSANSSLGNCSSSK